jgi:hypothetical protein
MVGATDARLEDEKQKLKTSDTERGRKEGTLSML